MVTRDRVKVFFPIPIAIWSNVPLPTYIKQKTPALTSNNQPITCFNYNKPNISYLPALNQASYKLERDQGNQDELESGNKYT